MLHWHKQVQYYKRGRGERLWWRPLGQRGATDDGVASPELDAEGAWRGATTVFAGRQVVRVHSDAHDSGELLLYGTQRLQNKQNERRGRISKWHFQSTWMLCVLTINNMTRPYWNERVAREKSSVRKRTKE